MSGAEFPWGTLIRSVETLFAEIEKQARDGIRRLLEAARDRVGSLESSLLTPTPDGENLRFLVSVNPKLEGSDILVPCEKSIAGYAYTAGQLVAAADVAQEMGDKHFAEVDERTDSRTKVYLVAPVTVGERTIGVLTFYNRPAKEENEPFPPESIHLAQEFAARLASLLRFHQRLAAQMEVALRGLVSPRGGDSEAGSRNQAIELLERLESYSELDRAFVADLLDLYEKHRNESLLKNLELGATGNE